MSMNGVCVRIRSATLEGLLTDTGEESRALCDYVNKQKGLPTYLDLRKNWHGLHFLLNAGEAASRSAAVSAVLGGVALSNEDEKDEQGIFGYGPIRYLTPQQVRDVSDSLQSLTVEVLVARYDANAMIATGVYPFGWDSEENKEYLLESFPELQRFYREAAEAGDGILLFLR